MAEYLEYQMCLKLHQLFFRCVLAITVLDASSHLYNRVCPSVRPSVRQLVRRSVTLLSKTREINILEQIVARGGIPGSLDASSHLYKTVYPCIGQSVHRSVCQASVNINLNKSWNHTIIISSWGRILGFMGLVNVLKQWKNWYKMKRM